MPHFQEGQGEGGHPLPVLAHALRNQQQPPNSRIMMQTAHVLGSKAGPYKGVLPHFKEVEGTTEVLHS